MKFWVGWQAWERMVFVLACAIVFVVAIGFGVAWFNRWKLRMYTRASTEEAERARNMWRQQFMMDDVPFGARALESGVQVDGIYTPRHNTPRRTTSPFPPDSPAMSTPSSPPTPKASRPYYKRFLGHHPSK